MNQNYSKICWNSKGRLRKRDGSSALTRLNILGAAGEKAPSAFVFCLILDSLRIILMAEPLIDQLNNIKTREKTEGSN